MHPPGTPGRVGPLGDRIELTFNAAATAVSGLVYGALELQHRGTTVDPEQIAALALRALAAPQTTDPAALAEEAIAVALPQHLSQPKLSKCLLTVRSSGR